MSCQILPHFTAGLYNISEKTYLGNADKSTQFSSVSVLSGRRYDIAIHPTISSVSPSTGSIAGTEVLITGTGFDTNASNNVVNAAGVNCMITSVTETSILCVTEKAPTGYNGGKIINSTATQVAGYISGVGFFNNQFNISACTDKTISGVIADLNSGSPATTNIGYRTVLDLEEYGVPKDVSNNIIGYFKPPKTGVMKFHAKSDSKLKLYINSTYGTSLTVDYTLAPALEIANGKTNPTASSAGITVSSVDHYYYF